MTNRWYHRNINGRDAEALLKEQGHDGSFLVRPSQQTKDGYSLSVRRGDAVVHIKIQNDGDSFDLYGGEKYATLPELVRNVQQHPPTDQNNEKIRIIEPFNAEYPTFERWYHGFMSGADAERLLTGREEGTFLIRESQREPGSFVLSVVTSAKAVEQIQILRAEKNLFFIKGADKKLKFPNLAELVDYYKKNPAKEKKRGNILLKKGYNATRINAAEIERRMTQLAASDDRGADKSNGGYKEEFEELQKMEESLDDSRFSEGKKPENRKKNRYKNILPFDSTRVKLTADAPEDANLDYINANYVKPEDPNGKQYIATQGTLQNTVVDFWRMIWQENSRIIVMTTKEVEKGRNKCVRYWPDEEEEDMTWELHDGAMRVTFVSEEVNPNYILREWILERFDSDSEYYQGESERHIFQFHYTVWPDHGVPADPTNVLSFLQNVDKKHKEWGGHVTVHCSAGIGRTGTFIIIDMLLDEIIRKGLSHDIDIHHTVQHVRKQRSGMVQTDGQYEFIYKAIHHYVEKKVHGKKGSKSENATGHVYNNN